MNRKVTLPTQSGDITLNATGHTHTIENGEFECDECADAVDQLNGNADFASTGVRTADIDEGVEIVNIDETGKDEEPPINIGKGKAKR